MHAVHTLDCDSDSDSAGLEANLAGVLHHDPVSTHAKYSFS